MADPKDTKSTKNAPKVERTGESPDSEELKATQREQDLVNQITTAITELKKMARPNWIVVGHFGAIQIDGAPATWWSIRHEHVTDGGSLKLLLQPEYKVAQVLSVLGSEVRLSILRSLYAAPKTAAELIADLKLSTTGQAYHHLRELERASYVEQKSGGRYHFNLQMGRVYLTALALAADADAKEPDEPAA